MRKPSFYILDFEGFNEVPLRQKYFLSILLISLSKALIKNIFDGPKFFDISKEMHFVSLFRHF